MRTLPGIGGYTAAAIAAIAFSRRAVAIDGNIERVIARLYAIETELPAALRVGCWICHIAAAVSSTSIMNAFGTAQFGIMAQAQRSH